MQAVLDYCTGGNQRAVPAGTLVLHEGSKTGHLFVLLEGRLEVIKGDSVVAAGGAVDRAAAGAAPQRRQHLSGRPDASICRSG